MANNYGEQMSRGTGHMYLIRSEEIMHNKTQIYAIYTVHSCFDFLISMNF